MTDIDSDEWHCPVCGCVLKLTQGMMKHEFDKGVTQWSATTSHCGFYITIHFIMGRPSGAEMTGPRGVPDTWYMKMERFLE